jgi:hypothetical protein
MSALNQMWDSLLVWDSLLGCPPKLATARFCMILVASLMISGVLLPSSAQQSQKKSAIPRASTTSQNLHKLGEAIAKAVLDKNIKTLLTFDRADLRSQDEVALKNSKSSLYCYIFDSDCITWGDGNWRSVYEKLSQAKQLAIKVSVSSSRYDRQLYGNLFFYDASAVSERDLRSADFLCKETPTSIASWKFRLEGGKWKAVTPLFDSETGGSCPGGVQGNGQ